jgi:hypothetical protein
MEDKKNRRRLMELDEFVCEHNLEHFRRLANLSTSAAERQAILELLAEKVGKLKSVPKGRAGEARKTTHTEVRGFLSHLGRQGWP